MTRPNTSPEAKAGPEAPEAAARLMAQAALEAGALALSKFRSADLKSWNKHNDSPVTEADMAVDGFLKERLGGLAPDYGWLSEESIDSAARLARRRVWVVDPIDGTRSFMSGGEDWAVSAALVEDGRPIAGVLFAPVTEELFVASRGAGTTVNGKPVRATGREALADAAVSGPAFMLDTAARFVPLLRKPRVRSLALRLARVATGELDVALASANSYDWDIAAADILVGEAGGALTGYDGKVLQYNASTPRHGPLVCTGTRLHAPMLELARSAFSSL